MMILTTSSTMATLNRRIIYCKSMRCILLRCLAASLISTHQLPGAFLPCLQLDNYTFLVCFWRQSHLQLLLGAKSSPISNNH